MSAESIIIRGACENNLKDVDIDIPKEKLVVFTGVSGSGKSSLVFDTINAEAQRQLLETFSSFARSRLPRYSEPEAEEIRHLSTAIVIDQRRLGKNSRSTVGTFSEIYTLLRLLFARHGKPFVGYSNVFSFNNPEGMCTHCQGVGSIIQPNLERLIDRSRSIREFGIRHSMFCRGWNRMALLECRLFDMDKPLGEFSEEEMDLLLYGPPHTYRYERHFKMNVEGIIPWIMKKYAELGEVKEEDEYLFDEVECPYCLGSRLKQEVLACRINGRNIAEVVHMEMTDLEVLLRGVQGELADQIIARMLPKVQNLIDIGVGYLSLNRQTGALSGGEAQRLKLARQLNCELEDLLYILDEPSIGLHARDVHLLNDLLFRLRDKGNSVLVIEHDPVVIDKADWVVDMGPGAGIDGGRIVFEGSADDLRSSGTLTGQFMNEHIPVRGNRRTWSESLPIRSADVFNLKSIDVDIPLGVFTCITGVAGSGKSTLLHEVFLKDHSDAVVIDQAPVGRSSRSTPATYTKVFDEIRRVFAKENDVSASLFSFNSAGACKKCHGRGYIEVEMAFLEPVKMHCPVCNGHRFDDEVLGYLYHGKNISEVLDLTINQALGFFKDDRIIRKKISVLADVGLGYMALGQSLSTLSGGEAQRVKIAKELTRHGNIYILDEPTTGLHMSDIKLLLGILDRLVEQGNTVIVIEHNLDVIKNADWIIDLGPEGGSRGGQVMGIGTPEEIVKIEESYTGQYLKNVLSLC